MDKQNMTGVVGILLHHVIPLGYVKMQNGWRQMQMDVNMAHACKAQGYVCLVGKKTYTKVVLMGGIQINNSIFIFNKYIFVIIFSKTIFILPLMCRYVHHVIRVELKLKSLLEISQTI